MPSSRLSPFSASLARLSDAALAAAFERAIESRDGTGGAQAIHETWMRGAFPANIERMLARLWDAAAETIPDWLPMRYVDRLPEIYATAARFRADSKGRSNLYLVLLDYRDSRDEPYGLYVGMTSYPPARRFDQHKAGIRAAGSVLQRGLELLAGPTRHLQRIARADAARIEEALAEALRGEGFFVQGGH